MGGGFAPFFPKSVDEKHMPYKMRDPELIIANCAIVQQRHTVQQLDTVQQIDTVGQLDTFLDTCNR